MQDTPAFLISGWASGRNKLQAKLCFGGDAQHMGSERTGNLHQRQIAESSCMHIITRVIPCCAVHLTDALPFTIPSMMLPSSWKCASPVLPRPLLVYDNTHHKGWYITPQLESDGKQDVVARTDLFSVTSGFFYVTAFLRSGVSAPSHQHCICQGPKPKLRQPWIWCVMQWPIQI